MKIMTYNIRVDCPVDWFRNRNWWLGRRKKVIDVIKSEDPDIICVQEIKHQLQLLSLRLSLPGYKSTFYGNSTDKGYLGEGLAIFYKKDKFKQINSNFMHLSETPYKAGKGWDAYYKMVCMWSLLQNKETKEYIPILNAHPDSVGIIARNGAANIILSVMKDYNNPIITGDMNFNETTEPYKRMIEHYNDAYYQTENQGQISTYNGWKLDIVNEQGYRGDIFFTNRKVISYKVIKSIASDHFPVVIEI